MTSKANRKDMTRKQTLFDMVVASQSDWRDPIRSYVSLDQLRAALERTAAPADTDFTSPAEVAEAILYATGTQAEYAAIYSKGTHIGYVFVADGYQAGPYVHHDDSALVPAWAEAIK